MTPFAIAGVQMHVAALHPNVEAMGHRIDLLMGRFPWTQMVLFSELAPYGPLDRFAQPFPNPAVAGFQDKARQHGIWLIPGSMFELGPDGRVRNTAVVIDPDGAPLGLLRSRIGDPVDTAEPALHQFLWTEHLSRNPQASADFYAALAGFEVRKLDFGPRAYWVLVKGRERAGLLRNPLAVDRPVWLSYVRVADVVASFRRAKELGGRVLLPPRSDLRDGSMALIADPTGAMLALQTWPVRTETMR